jgi:hypothetical protein
MRKSELKAALHFIQLLRMNLAYALEETKQKLAADRSQVCCASICHWKRFRPSTKDQRILLAAMHGKADYSLTGDARYFDHLYRRRIEGGPGGAAGNGV